MMANLVIKYSLLSSGMVLREGGNLIYNILHKISHRAMIKTPHFLALVSAYHRSAKERGTFPGWLYRMG